MKLDKSFRLSDKSNICLSCQVKVMQKQLLLFHNAVSAYFSGNQTSLEATMKQFAIKVRNNSTKKNIFF